MKNLPYSMKLAGTIALAAVIGLSITACRLDNNNGPTVTSVTVSPAAVTAAAGQTRDFSATVAGTNNPAQTVL